MHCTLAYDCNSAVQSLACCQVLLGCASLRILSEWAELREGSPLLQSLRRTSDSLHVNKLTWSATLNTLWPGTLSSHSLPHVWSPHHYRLICRQIRNNNVLTHPRCVRVFLDLKVLAPKTTSGCFHPMGGCQLTNMWFIRSLLVTIVALSPKHKWGGDVREESRPLLHKHEICAKFSFHTGSKSRAWSKHVVLPAPESRSKCSESWWWMNRSYLTHEIDKS